MEENKNLPKNVSNYLKEEKADQIMLSTKIDGSSRIYKFTGPSNQEQTMLSMLVSLTSNIEGLQSYNPAEKQ